MIPTTTTTTTLYISAQCNNIKDFAIKTSSLVHHTSIRVIIHCDRPCTVQGNSHNIPQCDATMQSRNQQYAQPKKEEKELCIRNDITIDDVFSMNVNDILL